VGCLPNYSLEIAQYTYINITMRMATLISIIALKTGFMNYNHPASKSPTQFGGINTFIQASKTDF